MPQADHAITTPGAPRQDTSAFVWPAPNYGPPKPLPPEPEPSRRNVLAAFTGAVAAGAALVTAGPQTARAASTMDHPDARLLALCMRLEDVARRVNSMWLQGIRPRIFMPAYYIKDDDEREIATAPLNATMDDLFDQITDQPLKTLEGCQAVARCLALTEPDLRLSADETVDGVGVSYRAAYVLHWLTAQLTGGAITWESCMIGPGELVA